MGNIPWRPIICPDSRLFALLCLFWLLLPVTALAQDAPPDSTDFQSGLNWISEAGFYYGTGSSLLAGHFVAWEAGPLFRSAQGRVGLGPSLYFAADDDVWQLGIKVRARRFINRDFLRYLELAFGTVLTVGGRESEVDRIDPPLFMAHAQLGLWDWLALTAQVQVTEGPSLDLGLWGGGGSSGNMNFHLGLTARQKSFRWLLLPLLAYLALRGSPL